ncbi:MAG: signal peptidase I [Sphingomonadaceae bacterium]
MSDTETPQAAASPEAPQPIGDETKAKKSSRAKREDSFAVFVLKLAVIVLIFRSFFFSPFNIPSESMLPALENGDYLLAAKWPYGYSKYSMPFNAPLIPGRILGGEPERGDIAIFKHPVDGTDYIKRVVGLPGDSVEMRGGQVILNGTPIPKVPVEDFRIAVSPNTDCAWGAVVDMAADGSRTCVYKQFKETLPDGTTYNVLDFGPTPQDNFPAVIVPDGSMFVMGDNRDNSQDSRFPAIPNGGVGMVPQSELVGRASFLMWSTDGSAEWIKPWTWFTAARWNRLGNGL